MTAPILDLDLPPEHPLRQILDTISAHPEVREPLMRALLTEDFLALPAQVQDLSGRVDGLTDQVGELRSDFKDFREETREQFGVVSARIDETNTRLDETNSRLDETNSRLDETNSRLDETNTRIDETNTRIDETNSRLDETNSRLGETNTRLDETNSRLDETNSRLDETNRSMQEQFRQVNRRIDDSADSVVRRIEGSLGRFRGETYEKRCIEKIDELLADHFGYAQPLDREPINRQLAQVRQDGTISNQEYLDGRNVDIIAHDAFAYDDARRWAVVEVSITFNRSDLENAARRSAIIAHVFGVQTQAFVVTNNPWPDDVNAIAEQMGVTIVRYHDPAYEAQPL